MTLEEAEKKIRTAWIIGVISTFVTLIFTLIAMASEGGTIEVQGTSIGAWWLLDVFLGSLLVFGIYMKSRVAAVGMFTYFLISKLVIWTIGISVTGTAPGVLLGIAFLYIYFEGARGALTYHRLQVEDIPANPPDALPED
jgi:hypothetical protein